MTPSGAAVFEEKLYCSKCFEIGGFRAKQAATAQKAGTGVKAPSGPSKFGGGGAKCYSCNLTVYAAEAISYEKKSFHVDCLKCKNCSKKVMPAGAEARHIGDDIEVYCKKCWGELGLGRAQLNVSKAADPAPAAASPTPAAVDPAPADEPAPAAEEAT